ncbi:MAG: SWI/SNF-related matrix-associated actin-dependent regulator of chromatin subfamily A-like protein 1 [Solirubrobacteraceae bacterium]|nr:SWI/SNF-related matrix-associated actin-dependent regulator of chromatin subfamily A-like protein 1 [Solirubrobacteraceae bacterium]
MQLAPDRPNVELRRTADGDDIVVLGFPYDAHIVAFVRGIPGRRFDWDRREWWAPVGDWAAVHVAELLERFAELTASDEVHAWLAGVERRWVGRVGTRRHDGRGWWTLETRAGSPPEELLAGSVQHDGMLLAPLGVAGAAVLAEQDVVRLDAGARRCVDALLAGEDPPPPARLTAARTFDGHRLRLDVLWDPDAGAAFCKLPGAEARSRTLPIDPWVVEPLDAYLASHAVAVDGPGAHVLAALRAEHDEARATIRHSRAVDGEPIAAVAAVLGGELAPFQWAGVRYVLDARRAFIADEQGLGKTVEALAALEADGAFPAVVVCPASLKLNWERETARWLAHRSVAVIDGRVAAPRTADITILNYEIVGAHRDALARTSPRALVVDESHYVKNPKAKRTQAVRRLAETIAPDGLRLALSGTPVLNHAEELVSQLRVIGRLEDFGSGAQFARRFRGELSEERLHWHLRRRCFVRRTKAEVLPQLPAKRQVVVPVALSNEREYRLAEEDVVAWLRSQPLDLRELEARIAATLRAERLAQLGTLQRLAARGKLATALSWIDDFLQSGEPLVVFARHVEVQEAVLARFPEAAHLLGRDPVAARDATVGAFQDPGGPHLLVAATRVAAQGITLTRASNVAFLELEWTPAMHDQAEDRCHRIGQHDAVTPWYLLAADTIDETMAALIQRKRGIVAAVTDGRRVDGDGLVEAVVRELRDGRPLRHLRPVA